MFKFLWFCALVPNFPAIAPVPGAIVNLWLLFAPFVIKSISYLALAIVAAIALLGLSYALFQGQISIKYFTISLLPGLIYSLYSIRIKDALVVLRGLFVALFILSVAALAGFSVLDPLLQFVFGDSSGISGAGGGSRGRGLIYPEPSHAAPLLVLLLSVVISRVSFFSWAWFISLFFFAVIFYVLRSGSLALYLAIYLLTFFALADVPRRWRVTGFLSSVSIVFFGVIFFSHLRFFAVFEISYRILAAGNMSVESTAHVASGRFISTYVWLISGINSVFGFGFNITVEKFIALATALDVDYTLIGAFQRRGLESLPVLPRSFLSVVVGMYGWIGVLIFALYIGLYLRGRAVVDRSLFVVGVFYICVVGFPGNPIPWLMVLLATKRHDYRAGGK